VIVTRPPAVRDDVTWTAQSEPDGAEVAIAVADEEQPSPETLEESMHPSPEPHAPRHAVYAPRTASVSVTGVPDMTAVFTRTEELLERYRLPRDALLSTIAPVLWYPPV
jgi:hypothetical protein